jgi:hypothetical protein
MLSPLAGIEVLTFDVFGTVVDWQGTGIRVLKKKVKEAIGLLDLSDAGTLPVIASLTKRIPTFKF